MQMKRKMKLLLEQKRYNELWALLKEMNSADIAEAFAEIDETQMIVAYRLLSKDKAIDVFTDLEPDQQEDLINALSDQELYEVTSNLLMDDAADLIEEMPATVVKRILKHTPVEKRKIINQLLNYPEDSAGSVMTVEFVDLKANMTVEQAFQRIRSTGVNKETIYTCYVLDEGRILEGIISVRELLFEDRNTKVNEIMETNMITVHTHDDQEEVVKLLDKYELMALPVLDNENRLVGIITIDDAIDVIHDEDTEDFERMAAMAPAEDTYFRTTVWEHAKNRILWLLVLMFSSIITGVIINKYEAAFQAIPLLVSFFPMLMDTGGNCGSQASTLIIRGMAVDEIHPRDILKAMWKEARISIIVGTILAFINGIRIWIQYQSAGIAVVIALSIIATVFISKLLGCCLPILAKKLKMDPAIMAAPLITTIVDTCFVLNYFNIAVEIFGLVV